MRHPSLSDGLPIGSRAPEARSGRAVERPGRSGTGGPEGGGGFVRILVVDDDPAVRWALERALRLGCYKVTTA